MKLLRIATLGLALLFPASAIAARATGAGCCYPGSACCPHCPHCPH